VVRETDHETLPKNYGQDGQEIISLSGSVAAGEKHYKGSMNPVYTITIYPLPRLLSVLSLGTNTLLRLIPLNKIPKLSTLSVLGHVPSPYFLLERKAVVSMRLNKALLISLVHWSSSVNAHGPACQAVMVSVYLITRTGSLMGILITL